MVDLRREESIRRWPVPVAKFWNFIVRWTTDYCTGGCGYPITGRFQERLETYRDVRIEMGLCSTGGECQRKVQANPMDQAGTRYSEIRPQIIGHIDEGFEPGSDSNEIKVVRLTFTS